MERRVVLELLGRIRPFPRFLGGFEMWKGGLGPNGVVDWATLVPVGWPPGGGFGKSRKYFKGKTDVRLRDWEFWPENGSFLAFACKVCA